MATSSSPSASSSPPVDHEEEIELEWEEWDGKSPWLHHCVAGSIAGLAEHTLLYPLDTVKTHMQSYCADCPIPQQAAAAAQGGGGSGSAAAGGSGAPPRACVRNAAASVASAAASSSSSSATTAAAKLATTNAVESTLTGVGASLAEPGMKAAQHMTSPGNTVRPIQHGMLTTMSNLISHGHSAGNAYLPPGAQPRLAHVSMAAGAGTATSGVETVASSLASQVTVTQSTAAADAGKGFTRLWRGVQSVIYGCIPAHALYFSSYEAIKAVFQERQHAGHTSTVSTESNNLGPLGSSVAGATAAFCHDLIMSPLDTVKQRLQLGHYEGTGHAIRQIVRHEGLAGLYRSFPITLLTNLPYGMVMVSTNEYLREVLESDPTKPPDLKTSLLAGSGAGMVAAAVTTPLDRVKTRLQTQRMGAAIAITLQENQNLACEKTGAAPPPSVGGSCPKAVAERAMMTGSIGNPKYGGLSDAFHSIVREEGAAGLFRGMTPRLMTHTPAVAISWTAYEAAKRWLASAFPVHS
jgi:solute carrier family 25 iron transporter 28/37